MVSNVFQIVKTSSLRGLFPYLSKSIGRFDHFNRHLHSWEDPIPIIRILATRALLYTCCESEAFRSLVYFAPECMIYLVLYLYCLDTILIKVPHRLDHKICLLCQDKENWNMTDVYAGAVQEEKVGKSIDAQEIVSHATLNCLPIPMHLSRSSSYYYVIQKRLMIE